MAKNIEASDSTRLRWDASNPDGSLQALLAYVVDEARKSIDWYWRSKRSKSLLSRIIQLSAVVLTAGAGLLPLIGEFTKNDTLRSGLWATLFVGTAAALLGLDKAFGFSSGWTRYVLAATNIRIALEEFRMDWTALIARTSAPPTPEQIDALIRRATEFRVAAEGVVLHETTDWITEFKNNIARLEKDVSSQLGALKAMAERTGASMDTAAQPGSVELAIANGEKADKGELNVKLEGANGVVADETVVGAASWARANVPPGQYRVTVTAAIGAKPSSASAVAIVKPGEIVQKTVSLPS